MIYENKAALLADLTNAARAVRATDSLTGLAYQSLLRVEVATPAGPVLDESWQPFYELSENGQCMFGRLIPAVRDYVLIKAELVDDAYTGQDVDARMAMLAAKMVRLPAESKMVTWKHLETTIGVGRVIAVRATLAAAGQQDAEIEAIRLAIEARLDPEAKNPGADPASDEFRSQTDAMGAIASLTTNQIAAIKALGEQSWIRANDITLRRHQVEALTPA